MNTFKNKEMDILFNRSLAIHESLSNLGKYGIGTKLFIRLLIQNELKKHISKEEYGDMIHALRFFKNIKPMKLKNPIYDEYKNALIKKVKSRRWPRRIMKNFWKLIKNLWHIF